jgi:hypothetical protein
MKTLRSKIASIKGVTLIEALIALFLTGIVTAAIFELYINQHKNWTIQGEVTDMQQNARAAMDELTRHIRMAGYELPIGLWALEAHNTNPDTILINYANGDCDIPIEHAMPLPSAELRCDGHDVSCFQDGQWAFIFQPDSGGGEFFLITLVQTGSSHIQHNTMPLSKCYPKDAIIVSLQQIKFYVDYSDSAHPNLMIDLPWDPPQIYAENIEDLQFQYRMKNGTIVDVPPLVQDVREVLITLTSRTDNPDPDFPNDPYRRRTYTSRVNLRNLDS